MLQELQQQANTQDIRSIHSSAETLSGETESTSKGTNQEQMVPVSEAIKYRKRAQVAEQQVQKLTEKLQNSQQIQQDTQVQLNEKEQENKLTQELVQAGVVDVDWLTNWIIKNPGLLHKGTSRGFIVRSVSIIRLFIVLQLQYYWA